MEWKHIFYAIDKILQNFQYYYQPNIISEHSSNWIDVDDIITKKTYYYQDNFCSTIPIKLPVFYQLEQNNIITRLVHYNQVFTNDQNYNKQNYQILNIKLYVNQLNKII